MSIKYTVNLPHDMTLNVEIEDRPVDFEIVFKSGKKVTFSRPEGDIGKVEAKIEKHGLLPAEISEEALTPISGRAQKNVTVKDGGASFSYRDPGM